MAGGKRAALPLVARGQLRVEGDLGQLEEAGDRSGDRRFGVLYRPNQSLDCISTFEHSKFGRAHMPRFCRAQFGHYCWELLTQITHFIPWSILAGLPLFSTGMAFSSACFDQHLEVAWQETSTFQVTQRIFNFQVADTIYPDFRFKLPFGWFRFCLHGSHPVQELRRELQPHMTRLQAAAEAFQRKQVAIFFWVQVYKPI